MKNKIVITCLFIMFALVKNANAELNASNYQTYEPDFVFEECSGFLFRELAEQDCRGSDIKNLYCIPFNYGKLGQAPKVREKYLGKIIKFPLYTWTTISNDDGTAYLSDIGSLSEDQTLSQSVTCHLIDENNIEKYVDETGNKKGDVEVIGKISEIKGSMGAVALDPCYYIKKINK